MPVSSSCVIVRSAFMQRKLVSNVSCSSIFDYIAICIFIIQLLSHRLLVVVRQCCTHCERECENKTAQAGPRLWCGLWRCLLSVYVRIFNLLFLFPFNLSTNHFTGSVLIVSSSPFFRFILWLCFGWQWFLPFFRNINLKMLVFSLLSQFYRCESIR